MVGGWWGGGGSYDPKAVQSQHRGRRPESSGSSSFLLPPDVTIQLLQQLMGREDSPGQERLLRGAGGGERGQRAECMDSDRPLVGCVNTLKRLQ